MTALRGPAYAAWATSKITAEMREMLSAAWLLTKRMFEKSS